jgi:hypothetical protein
MAKYIWNTSPATVKASHRSKTCKKGSSKQDLKIRLNKNHGNYIFFKACAALYLTYLETTSDILLWSKVGCFFPAEGAVAHIRRSAEILARSLEPGQLLDKTSLAPQLVRG